MLCSLADYFEVTTDELLGRARKGTFMVCDDAGLICMALRDILEKEGYVCAGLAEDGAQLHVLFDETIPDILFLDVHLATESGIDLLKEVKEKYNSTKVIMVTADNTEETLQDIITYGADALVTKPFLPEHVITALETI